MHESEAEVLARIEATRARMGETIDEIGDRVNPDRVQAELKARARNQVREVKANVKDKARNAMRDIEHEVTDAGRGLWETIRENPIPAGMVGVGLAWLVANSATSSRHHDDPGYRAYRPATGGAGGYAGYVGTTGIYTDYEYEGDYGYDVRDRAGEPLIAGEDFDASQGRTDEARERIAHAAEDVKDRASETADRVRDKARDAKDQVLDQAEHAAHATRRKAAELQHRAGSAARNVGNRAQRAERRVENAVQDNPLAASAIAAALGFAAGMMIPETHREREMFGPTRDRMMENAERKVRQAGEKAKDVARETASESARQAVDEVWPGSKGRQHEAVSDPGR